MQKKDEIDFLELLKHPVRLFGLTYVYFLLAGGFLGVYYIWSMNTITRNTVKPVALKDSTQFILDVPMQRGALIAPVNVVDVSKPTKELIAKGANLYKANCASCHGDNGMGDGLSAAAMTVKPRNFHSADGWKNGRKISNIYQTLQNGILTSGMPAFNYTPAEDRFAMIHYIRTFADNFPVDSLSDILQLETLYNLSKGSQLPAQIPVAMALKKLAVESESDAAMVKEFCATIADPKQEERGAMIAKDVSRDQPKVASLAMAVSGKGVDEFIRIVSSDPGMVGFKAKVLRLNADEWNALYSYITKISREKKNS